MAVLEFLAAFGLLMGYMLGAGFLVIAAFKPIFPENVGVYWRERRAELGRGG